MAFQPAAPAFGGTAATGFSFGAATVQAAQPAAPAPAPASADFEVRVPGFSKLSAPFESRSQACIGHNWRVRVHPLGAREGLGWYVAADLIFDEPPPPPAKASRSFSFAATPPPPQHCTADVTLTLVSTTASASARASSRNFAFSPQTETPQASNELLFNELVPLEELRSRRGGFLEDDTLTIRVSLKTPPVPSKPRPTQPQTIDLTLDTLIASPELWATVDNLHRTRTAPAPAADSVPLNRLKTLAKHIPFTPHDFRIVVGGQSLGAHREVLARGSSYFRSGALEHMREGQEGVLQLEEGSHGQPVTFAAAEAALRYMYTHVSPAVPAAELRPLLALACYWGVRGLPSLCVDAILQTVTVANVVETFLWAHSQGAADGPEGEEAVWRLLQARCRDIVSWNLAQVANWTPAASWEAIDEQIVLEFLGGPNAKPGLESVALLEAWARARHLIGPADHLATLLPSLGELPPEPVSGQVQRPAAAPVVPFGAAAVAHFTFGAATPAAPPVFGAIGPQQQQPAAAAPASSSEAPAAAGSPTLLQRLCLLGLEMGLDAVAAAAEREMAESAEGPGGGPALRLLLWIDAPRLASVIRSAAAANRPAASSAAAARAWIRARPNCPAEAAEQVLSSVPWAQISLAEYPVYLQDPVLKGYACLDRLLAEAQYERMVPPDQHGKRPPVSDGSLAEAESAWKRVRTGE
eukprot:tig00020563_g11274.t1